MYLSIRDATILETGFDQIDEGLRYFDIVGIELAVNRDYQVRSLTGGMVDLRSDTAVDSLADEAETGGFRIAALLLPNNFNSPDIERDLAWITHTVITAGRLGVPAVRIDAIMTGEREMPLDQRIDLFAARVNSVLDETSNVPVDLGIENHGFQGNDPAFLDRLLAAVNSTRLGLTLDTGNFYWSGHPLSEVYRIIAHFAKNAKHTHAKNIRYPEELREERRALGYEYGKYVCPIAEGDIDHARVIAELKAAGYDRDLCLEDESLGKFDIVARRANIRAAADQLRAML